MTAGAIIGTRKFFRAPVASRFLPPVLVWIMMILSCWSVEDGAGPLSVPENGLIVDHRHTNWTSIPAAVIADIKAFVGVHLAHTSHGEQIPVGLERLAHESDMLAFARNWCAFPLSENRLRMIAGQYIDAGGYCETYVTPELYWQGGDALAITRNMLRTHDIEVTIWTWCSQLDHFTRLETEEYLNALNDLEAEFPDVIFVYMTGNAQSVSFNRHARNNQIRQFCRDHDKVLFDFADLDCWYDGQQHTVEGIPCEHPEYHGDEAGHTTLESCQNKAGAFWWMLARLVGWDET